MTNSIDHLNHLLGTVVDSGAGKILEASILYNFMRLQNVDLVEDMRTNAAVALEIRGTDEALSLKLSNLVAGLVVQVANLTFPVFEIMVGYHQSLDLIEYRIVDEMLYLIVE